ncbi:hypothetical protein [Gemmatimonas sp.]|jgi:hypothetical protein|uniref:SDH family Clp fold serine proteinase n=1 Tax=Gemmatimonas sp. TaxID=1962908 RepID=UPI0037C0665C
MNIAERKQRYEAIEQHRDRPLIVYATSTRLNVQAMMAGDAVRQFIDQIDAVPQTSASVDVLIHSTGGDALTAWKLMSLLRERFTNVAVLVPFSAFSAATVFAMGADEIVMHPHASLGPIDPQIQIGLPDGSRRQFAFEDVGAFLRFVSGEAHLTEQAHVGSVIDHLLRVVDPVHIGAAKRASELSTDIGERLLHTHMIGESEKSRARAIAESLNKKFFAHGDAVSRSRARDLNLKVAAPDVTLEKLLWSAFEGIEEYMELRDPWNPLHHFQRNGGAAALVPSAPVNLPANAPPQLVQQVWQQVMNNVMQSTAQQGIQVDYSIINAVVESSRTASEHRTEGALSAVRVVGGDVQLSAVERSARWVDVPLT